MQEEGSADRNEKKKGGFLLGCTQRVINWAGSGEGKGLNVALVASKE